MKGIFSGLLVSLTLTSAANLWQRWGHEPDVDPLGSHCFDVTVDMDDTHAVEWQKANDYKYTAWKEGLCDTSVWPTIEMSTHPSASANVTLRKMGHGSSLVAPLVESGEENDCRKDNTSKPLSIVFTNKAGASTKIRGCLNGIQCSPYSDCDSSLAAGDSETIVFDASFKYFLFSFKGTFAGKETALYPDANLKFPATHDIQAPSLLRAPSLLPLGEDYFVINSPSPGSHAHCTELTFAGGKNNAYYQDHGYQYQPPIWTDGPCDKKYNWFNRNTTIAEGVVQTELGIH